MDTYQYRITVNDSTGAIMNEYPGQQWSIAAQYIEDRGGKCTFHRRFITDTEILPMLTNPTGWLKLKSDVVVSPWEVIAEVEVI